MQAERIHTEKSKKEACGLIAVINHEDPAQLCAKGLFALQHRGEEACGICVLKDKKFVNAEGLGFINKVFTKESLKKLDGGHSAIAHTRYSTSGSTKSIKDTQPFLVNRKKDSFAIAHNGNIVNANILRDKLEKKGAIFQSASDSEVFLHLIATTKKDDFEQTLIEVCRHVEGAFNLLIMHQEGIYAIRDPHGFKPLCYGVFKDSESIFSKGKKRSYAIASETCALDLIEAEYINEVKPGEMLFISYQGEVRIKNIFETPKQKKCIFELIYFARPDSYLFGESAYHFRKQLGRHLAQENPVNADMVVPIPDSGTIIALGYAQEANIPMELAITKNLYASRSFIQPTKNRRQSMVRMKLNPISQIIQGKKIVLIDDSIVRGTTIRQKIEAIRQCGAKEIHLRIASARIMHPCYYGIDFPQASELIANKMSMKKMKEFLQVDSFAHLSIEAMVKASNIGTSADFCLACFNGKYPTDTFREK